MEINIVKGEELRVIAKDDNGEEHVAFISYQQILKMGERLIDGLTHDEVAELSDKKKIMAIKLVRLRTGLGLKKAKEVVDAWIERNRCCGQYPYCDHQQQTDGLDRTLLTASNQGDLSLRWMYNGEITQEQAKGLMHQEGYNPDDFGCWSFESGNNHTTWYSNRLK